MYQGKVKLTKLHSKNNRTVKKTFADKIGIKSRKKDNDFDVAEELSLTTSMGFDHLQKVKKNR